MVNTKGKDSQYFVNLSIVLGTKECIHGDKPYDYQANRSLFRK